MPVAEQMFDVPYERIPGSIRITRKQCDVLRQMGLLKGRYELIDGEIISKTGQNPPHGAVGVLLNAWLISVFGPLFVRIQTSIDIGDADPEHNDPEPDAAVTLEPTSAYFKRLPGPADLVMVCEVSDTTARLDRTAKAALYASAGIVEYWILDIPRRQLLIHRQPTSSGYAERTICGEDDLATPLARPDFAVRVADLLPPAALAD